LFEVACCHAALAGNDAAGVPAIEADVHAAEALTLLRPTIAAGFCDPVTFRTETALDPLRDRPDFRMLMMDVPFRPTRSHNKPSRPTSCGQ
jgi:hypothetical protein